MLGDVRTRKLVHNGRRHARGRDKTCKAGAVCGEILGYIVQSRHGDGVRFGEVRPAGMRRAHDSHPDRMSPARRVFECLCRTQQTVAVESPFIDILPCLGQNIRRKILAEGGEHAYARGRDVVGGVLQQVDIAAEGLFHLFTALFDVPCALSRPCDERSRSKDAPGVLPAAEGGKHVAAH